MSICWPVSEVEASFETVQMHYSGGGGGADYTAQPLIVSQFTNKAELNNNLLVSAFQRYSPPPRGGGGGRSLIHWRPYQMLERKKRGKGVLKSGVRETRGSRRKPQNRETNWGKG